MFFFCVFFNPVYASLSIKITVHMSVWTHTDMVIWNISQHDALSIILVMNSIWILWEFEYYRYCCISRELQMRESKAYQVKRMTLLERWKIRYQSNEEKNISWIQTVRVDLKNISDRHPLNPHEYKRSCNIILLQQISM